MKGMHLKTPGAICLDMDDTILASRESSRNCWKRLCDRHAPKIDGLTPQAMYAAVHDSIQWYWKDPERNAWGRVHPVQANRRVVESAFRSLGIGDFQAARDMADSFHMERIRMIQPFPGAFEALRHFHGAGIRLALITNGSSRMQRSKIDKFKLDRFFDCILIEEEFGVGKPDKRIFRQALEQLRTEPQDAWMVGDNLECDIEGPQRLGIFSIWNDFEGSGLPDAVNVRPDAVVGSLFELTAHVSRYLAL